MRGKYQFWLHLILVLSLIVITVNLSPVYASPTALKVVPPTIIDTTKTPGTTFIINVYVDDVEHLSGFDFNQTFDPTVLNATKITLGDFFGGPTWIGPKPDGPSIEWIKEINNITGYVRYSVSWGKLSPYYTTGRSGSGTLAIIEFIVKDVGITPLDLFYTELTERIDSDFEEIPHEVYDGYFSNTGYANPVAGFTFTPASPILGDTVTFDASASYHPDVSRTIVSWDWDFGDGSSGSGKIVEHIYTDAGGGTQTVTLTVTDDSSPPLTDAAEKDVTVSGHNVAVINVQPNQTFVMQNRTISINVTVKNKGSEGEKFNVTACYNGTPVAPLQTTALSKNTNRTLTFDWNTSGVAKGTYIISANASEVEGENIPDDNFFIDGTVTIFALPVAKFTHWPPDGYAVVNKPVEFDASESYAPDGEITKYMWDFGDGTKKNTTHPINTISHSYSANGSFIVKLMVIDDAELVSQPAEKTLTVVNERDIEVTSVTVSPTKLRQGLKVTINATISNVGEAPETFRVAAYYNQTPIDANTLWIKIGEKSVTFLQPQKSTTLTLDWDTSGVTTERYYQILVNATEVYHETNVTNNARLSDPIYIRTPPLIGLDLIVDVGAIHFGGETAEFYILTLRTGQRVNVNITATLYFNGTIKEEFADDEIQPIKTGLYIIRYYIEPENIESGTYTLHVEAKYFDLEFNDILLGNTLKSFLVSQTLTGWNPMLISINGTVGTIKHDVGLIEVKLADINAKLVSIEGNIVTISSTIGLIQTDISTINGKLTDINGTLATIQTDIGLIQTDIADIQLNVTAINGNMATILTTLGTIEGRITSIEGDIATIETDIGTVKVDISKVKGAQEAFTTPLYIVIIPALIAAVGAILAIIFIRRKPKI